MNLRIAFQAEIDRGGRTSVLDVVAYGARSDKSGVRIALLHLFKTAFAPLREEYHEAAVAREIQESI